MSEKDADIRKEWIIKTLNASSCCDEVDFIPESFGVSYDRVFDLDLIDDDIKGDSDVLFMEPQIAGNGVQFTPYELSSKRARRVGIHNASWVIILSWAHGTYNIRLEGNTDAIFNDLDQICRIACDWRRKCDDVLSEYCKIHRSRCEVGLGVIRIRGYR